MRKKFLFIFVVGLMGTYFQSYGLYGMVMFPKIVIYCETVSTSAENNEIKLRESDRLDSQADNQKSRIHGWKAK